MELPDYQRFYLETPEQLRAEIDRLGLNLAVNQDTDVLMSSWTVAGHDVANRMCAQPIEGRDAQSCGAPSETTHRRYRRYVEGGFGTIWVEACAYDPGGRSSSRQLLLSPETLPHFTDWVRDLREAAQHDGHAPLLILQLAHAGRQAAAQPVIARRHTRLDAACGLPDNTPLVTDEELKALQNTLVQAVGLAQQAGFDGVDIKCSHFDLPWDLLTAHERPGQYGGAFANRSRFLREAFQAARVRAPGLLLASRLQVYDAMAAPDGWGTDPQDPRRADPTELIALVRMLQEHGLDLLMPAWASPQLGAPTDALPIPDTAPPREHPLATLARGLDLVQQLGRAVPGLDLCAGGFSWLRQLFPYAAAAVLQPGWATLVGLGRGALAYPDAPRDLHRSGHLDPSRCCMMCRACSVLLRENQPVGCVLRDPENYGAIYRHQRRYASERLQAEAARCHDCEAAPCTAACPSGIDVPGFIRAYASGRGERAYEILQTTNAWSEMCSHLCPTWMLCEGACIETTLTGTPVAIHDLQYTVSRRARDHRQTGVSIPASPSGRRIAVVGGGPTGTSAAARLVERGHEVTILERADRLGGIPELILPPERCPDVAAEITARLAPAIERGRLTVHLNTSLEEASPLHQLRQDYDAVLLATGVWQECTPPLFDTTLDGLTLLDRVRRGTWTDTPERVALLVGGDSAMDAARTLHQLGCRELYIVYAGSRTDLHWHLDESWFTRPGVHPMFLTEALAWVAPTPTTDGGLRIARTQPGPDGTWSRIPDTESLLQVDRVITAMGLEAEHALRTALPGMPFSDAGCLVLNDSAHWTTSIPGVYAAGALVNGGATVAQCTTEGLQAATCIHQYLTPSPGEPA